MRRNNAESIGDLIRKYLRHEGQKPLNEKRLIDAWSEIIDLLSPHTPVIFTSEIKYLRSTQLYAFASRVDDGRENWCAV